MVLRKPTGSEMKWFGAGYGAGALTFPIVKRAAVAVGSTVVGWFSRDEEDEHVDVEEPETLIRSRSTTRKAVGSQESN